MIRGHYIKKEFSDKILQKFPNLFEGNYEDSDRYFMEIISIWDTWLFKSRTPKLLDQSNKDLEFQWKSSFRKFHEYILTNTKSYVYIIGNNQNKIKRIKSTTHVLSELEKNTNIILIPEMEVIYEVGHDFTSFLYFQNNENKEIFESWVKYSGLKFIREK